MPSKPKTGYKMLMHMQELAHTAAEHVLQEAGAVVATQVVEYVLPAIGAIVTVAMLPHTYAKIHRV